MINIIGLIFCCLLNQAIKVKTIDFKQMFDEEGHPVIEVKISDNTYNFLIDTGASSSIVFNKILTECNIGITASNKKLMALGSLSDMNYCNLSFSINNDNFNLSMVAMNASEILYHNEETGRDIHGILGNDFLKSTNAIINFANKELLYIVNAKKK